MRHALVIAMLAASLAPVVTACGGGAAGTSTDRSRAQSSTDDGKASSVSGATDAPKAVQVEVEREPGNSIAPGVSEVFVAAPSNATQKGSVTIFKTSTAAGQPYRLYVQVDLKAADTVPSTIRVTALGTDGTSTALPALTAFANVAQTSALLPASTSPAVQVQVTVGASTTTLDL